MIEESRQKKLEENIKFDIRNTVWFRESKLDTPFDDRQKELAMSVCISRAINVILKEFNIEYLEKKMKALREYRDIHDELSELTPNTDEWYILKAKEVEAYRKI